MPSRFVCVCILTVRNSWMRAMTLAPRPTSHRIWAGKVRKKFTVASNRNEVQGLRSVNRMQTVSYSFGEAIQKIQCCMYGRKRPRTMQICTSTVTNVLGLKLECTNLQRSHVRRPSMSCVNAMKVLKITLTNSRCRQLKPAPVKRSTRNNGKRAKEMITAKDVYKN